ncbi:hypothetical protein [Vibrio sp. YIC-376]|uniref:hypothetical protein n=1 Tax=Vibrio sp. YIC-376 TaxID=3136162 RepID=UPI00402B03F5
MMKGYTPMKKRALEILLFMGMIFTALLFLAPPMAIAVDDGSDRPEWAGNQGRDGKPGRGNTQPGTSKGDLYGDLLIIVRDDNGEPVKYTWDWDELDATIYVPQQDDNGCFQPIANEQASDALTGELLPALPEEFRVADGLLIPLDSECEIAETLVGYEDYTFANYTEEVDFGRLSVARSSIDVIDSSYAEAISNINSAASIKIDPAGRIDVVLPDGTIKTIDSPLENLALYKALMLNGHLPGLLLTNEQLGDLDHLLGNGVETVSQRDLDTAAALLAGAGDKFGTINLDLVININTILGINDNGHFDFMRYSYYRDVMYSGTEVGLLLPGVEPNPGAPVGISSLSYQVVPLLDIAGNPEAFTADQVHTDFARGFTQAADDSLRVINYIHNWALPDLPEGLAWE